jgi:hypothetical protein
MCPGEYWICANGPYCSTFLPVQKYAVEKGETCVPEVDYPETIEQRDHRRKQLKWGHCGRTIYVRIIEIDVPKRHPTVLCEGCKHDKNFSHGDLRGIGSWAEGGTGIRMVTKAITATASTANKTGQARMQDSAEGSKSRTRTGHGNASVHRNSPVATAKQDEPTRMAAIHKDEIQQRKLATQSKSTVTRTGSSGNKQAEGAIVLSKSQRDTKARRYQTRERLKQRVRDEKLLPMRKDGKLAARVQSAASSGTREALPRRTAIHDVGQHRKTPAAHQQLSAQSPSPNTMPLADIKPVRKIEIRLEDGPEKRRRGQREKYEAKRKVMGKEVKKQGPRNVQKRLLEVWTWMTASHVKVMQHWL